MNPLQFFALESSLEKLQKNHPKFCSFINTIAKYGVEEGTVLGCKVTLPNRKEINANLKLTKEDVELINNIKKGSPVK